MKMHLVSSVANMDLLYRGIEIQSATMANQTNHSMTGHSRQKVVVGDQFDDTVNEPPLHSHASLMQASCNQEKEVVENTTRFGGPVAATARAPPPPPLLSYYPAIVIVPSSMMQSQTPLTNMIVISAAPPSASPTTVIQEQIPPSLSFHNSFWMPSTQSNATTTNIHFAGNRQFAGNRYVPIAPRPINYEIPIAPRPVVNTDIPIASHPTVRFQGLETNVSSTMNQRMSLMKKLPTQTKQRHTSYNKENSDVCASSAYGTKLMSQIMKQKRYIAPFDDLLSPHPNAALIPNEIPPEERVPMMKVVQRDELCLFPVEFPKEMQPTDVLLGRGASSNRHMGNLFFRQLISYYRMAYHALPKGGKRQLSRNICNYVRMSGGRFLERRRHIQNGSHWYECGDGRALAKCAQALRETVRNRAGRRRTSTVNDEEIEEEDEEEDPNDDGENRSNGSE